MTGVFAADPVEGFVPPVDDCAVAGFCMAGAPVFAAVLVSLGTVTLILLVSAELFDSFPVAGFCFCVSLVFGFAVEPVFWGVEFVV